MSKALFSLLSPAGPKGRLSILIFHRVLPVRDALFPGEVTDSEFDDICAWVSRWFQVLPLAQAARRLRDRNLPERALCITFDDGYADNHDIALPLLQKHGLTATFFVATGFLDGGRMWNDTVIEAIRRTGRLDLDMTGTVANELGKIPCATLEQKQQAVTRVVGACKYLPQQERDVWVEAVAGAAGAELPDDLMMTTDMVRRLRRAGQDLGAHTATHPILARLDASQMEREIRIGRDWLQDVVGERVPLFAYPNGRPNSDYTLTAVEIVRSLGFDAAVTTAWGAATLDSDPFQLPRFTPWDRTRTRFAARLARNLWSAPPPPL